MLLSSCFFFNHPPPTAIYTLSLHDALPISRTNISTPTSPRTGRAVRPPGSPGTTRVCNRFLRQGSCTHEPDARAKGDRNTRLNSSHANISYAVFCLKKKKKKQKKLITTRKR